MKKMNDEKRKRKNEKTENRGSIPKENTNKSFSNVFSEPPPKMIICVSLITAVCWYRGGGMAPEWAMVLNAREANENK